jgi:hypothetical protein
MTEPVVIIPADRPIPIDIDDNIESVIKDRLTYLKNLNDIIIEKHYNKYKCSFNINSNNKTVDKIKQIELQLLQKYYQLIFFC